jgi:hypothetical protein
LYSDGGDKKFVHNFGCETENGHLEDEGDGDNIKMDFAKYGKIGCKKGRWMGAVQNRVPWRHLVLKLSHFLLIISCEIIHTQANGKEMVLEVT